jgi:hypothetical protein
VSIIEDKEFKGDELCLDKVQFLFKDTTVTITPIVDTNEINISQESNVNLPVVDTPSWCEHFIGKKLMTLWVCENDQGTKTR